MNNKQSIKVLKNKQRGATLFTSLVFLALMTIVGVSAAKIATLDTIVAGNNQQMMLVYQQTDRTLDGFSNPVVVTRVLGENPDSTGFDITLTPADDGSTSPHAVRNIRSRGDDIKYDCHTNGKANSVGFEVPKCRVIDLSAQDRLVGNGIVDRHFRGVGKRVPPNPQYQ